MNFMRNFDHDTIVLLVKTLAVAAAGIGLFYGLRGRMAAMAQSSKLPQLAFTPIRALLRYGILIGAALLVLSLWGYELGTLMALMGTVLGLVAIGFVAVWSVLSNFLCTFVLVAFKPFSVGDELELPSDNIRGRVIDLSLIFTTLQVSPTETVLIPNNTYFQRAFKRRRAQPTTEADTTPARLSPQPQSWPETTVNADSTSPHR